MSFDLRKQFDELVNLHKKATMNRLLTRLKQETPVDTGHARDSWRIEGDKIINDADYISTLNEGSSNQAPSNFIERTVLSENGVAPNGNIVTNIGG